MKEEKNKTAWKTVVIQETKSPRRAERAWKEETRWETRKNERGAISQPPKIRNRRLKRKEGMKKTRREARRRGREGRTVAWKYGKRNRYAMKRKRMEP